MARRQLKRYIKTLLVMAMLVFSATGANGKAEQASDAAYFQLSPPFTVNVGTPSPRVSFAKVDVSLRLTGEDARKRVQHHQPQIRDLLVSALSNQPLNRVETSPGRENLRTETLQAVQEFLTGEEGEPLVTDLLFTNFVVQR